jgi:hypothetical protein
MREIELHEALQRIGAIRAQMGRAEIFRGYNAVTVAGTGILALSIAALQPLLVPNPQHEVARYLLVWISVAGVSVAMVAAELAWRWLATDSPLAREQTRRAVEQFAPCIVAGAMGTWAIALYLPEAAAALPGLWAIVFSLGIFASWRQLTPLILCVAVHYLAAGAVCIALARGENAFTPWAMAGTFGVGQLLTAAVLNRTKEARHGQA